MASRMKPPNDAEIEATVLSTLMSHPNGRRWLFVHLSDCNCFHSFGSLDHAQMAYAEGKRSLGLRLMSRLLTIAPSLYVTMLEENSGTKLKDNSNGRSDPDTGTDDNDNADPGSFNHY